jgi:hypothetical protein
MRLIYLLLLAAIGYTVWKLVKIAKLIRNSGEDEQKAPMNIPEDHSLKNIEDADFEDIIRDPDKSS